MINLTLNVKLEADTYLIEFWPSSLIKNTISIEKDFLFKKYNIDSHEQLNIKIVRQIVRDNFKEVLISRVQYFTSEVKTYYSNNKKYKFQQENQLVIVLEVETGREVTCSYESISNVAKFSKSNFEKLNNNRKNITPLTNNIEPNEYTQNFFQ